MRASSRRVAGVAAALALAAALAAACGRGPAPPPAGPAPPLPPAPVAVPCGGALTCGPAEYCVVQCLCCGVPTDEPPRASYECRPVPSSCSPADLCSCTERQMGLCDAKARSVSVPCA